MARMTEAQWVGPHHDNGEMSKWDIVCIHTIVGNPPAHAAHFSVRSDGHVFQSRDTNFKSAANYNGNHRIIAIENDDFGSEYGDWDINNGHDVPEFTDIQCEAIAHTLVWCYRTHGIPLVACPNSKPGSRGIAYHRQGIKGNWAGYAYGGWVEGGELWSTKTGKVCPGDRRISQLHNTIIPRARIIAGLDQEIAKLTCAFNANDRQLMQSANARATALLTNSDNSDTLEEGDPAGTINNALKDFLVELKADVQALDEKITALETTLIQSILDWLDANPPTVTVDATAIANEVWAQARDNDASTGPVS